MDMLLSEQFTQTSELKLMTALRVKKIPCRAKELNILTKVKEKANE